MSYSYSSSSFSSSSSRSSSSSYSSSSGRSSSGYSYSSSSGRSSSGSSSGSASYSGPMGSGSPSPSSSSSSSCSECGDTCPTSPYPVRYHDGQIQMQVGDIALTDGAFTLTHTRKYDNLVSVQDDGPNGFGWKSTKVPVTMRYAGFWRTEFSENDSVNFDTTANVSGIYVALHGYPETMRMDTNNKTFVVTRMDGTVWTFNNDTTKNAPLGSLLTVVAPNGNVSEYVYNISKQLEKVQAYHNSFTSRILGRLAYVWDSSNRITSITLDKWNGTATTSIKRVSYTYHTGTDTFGNAGNLKTATQENYSGASWTAGETYYYRYYKTNDAKGKQHMLKMAFFPDEFAYFSATFGSTACFNTADATALNYSKKYYEYDTANRVVVEKVDRNTKTIAFAYTEYPNTTDHNAVHRKTVETGPFGEQNIVFTNFKGTVILKELKPPQGVSAENAIHYCKFDGDGKRTHYYHPKAVSSYTLATGTKATLNVTLSPNEGMVEITEYYDGTNNTPKGNVYREKIQRGTGASIIKTERIYEKRQIDAKIVWNVTKLTQYEDDANTKAIVTQYAYTYHSNSTKPEQRTTTYPAVPTAQNGSGVATSRIDRYDTQGRVIWQKDELGIITYNQYNSSTGLRTKSIQDVNTLQTVDFTSGVPSGWSTVSGAGKHLVNEYEYDNQGRITQTLGPKNTAVSDSNTSIEVRPASWTVYDDVNNTFKSANGFATLSGNTITGYTLVNPVSITIRNGVGQVLETIQASRASTSGKLSATDTFARSTYTAWTKNIYQGDRLTSTWRYHLIPTSGDGVKDTNYLETTFAYDSYGRQNKSTSPDGTITKIDFDWKNNPVKTWVGTTDANLVVVSETEYGDSGACSTCTGQRDKPKVSVQYVDATKMRITEYGYDWRGRQTHAFGESDDAGNLTYTLQTYDNFDRPVKSERFLLIEDSGTATPTGKEKAVILRNNPANDRLLARSEYFYDTRGQVWKTEQSVVNPSSGAVTGKLLGQSWYDAKGRLTKQFAPGANHYTENVFDSLGRVQKSSTKIDSTVFTQSETTYDNHGNAILTAWAERLSTASGTGALTTSTAKIRYMASWYDSVGRQIATADYGDNGGTAVSRPATVPTRSDTVLVTETKYDTSTGRAFRTIDPAGKDHRTYYDALGRTTKTIANYVTGSPNTASPASDVTVEFAYHASGQLSSLTAKNPATGDQNTKYVYGTSKAWISPLIYRNDVLTAEIYPDSDDYESGNILQNGPDGVVDRVEFQYNRAGETIWKRDQNGTVHNYEFDNLGRILHDRVTTLASGVDGEVRRISTVYETSGNVKSVTSYDNATIGSGNVVNQVLYEYDTNGLLSKDYSNPTSAVSVSTTPYTGYTYETTKSGDYFTKGLRPATLKYPGGKTLNYVYGATGSNDDKLNRFTAIKDGTTEVVQYVDNGVSTPVKVTYPQPGLTLDYTVSGALDRFGRIADHAWKKGTTDVVRIKHGYDRVGNRLYREDGVGTNFSEVYSYDGVNQLIDTQRGVINGTKTGVSTKKGQESFAFDATGNWGTFKQDNTGGGFTLNQTRTHNKANEITNLGVMSDRNGNMTKLPKIDNWSSAFDLTYDAWNRLVQVKDGTTTVATYAYNGLNHRVKKVVGSETRLFYFNRNWQCLEERIGTTVDTTYIWGLRYIDDLVCRDKETERLYSLADPNWNVVAIVDTSGTVKERIAYNSFGKPNWLDASFGAKTASSYTWTRTFTGQVLDTETGLMLYRNRFYHGGLGRFVTRDPIGYRAADVSLYRYVFNSTQAKRDSSGLKTKCNMWSPYTKSSKIVVQPTSEISGSISTSPSPIGVGQADKLVCQETITYKKSRMCMWTCLGLFYDLWYEYESTKYTQSWVTEKLDFVDFTPTLNVSLGGGKGISLGLSTDVAIYPHPVAQSQAQSVCNKYRPADLKWEKSTVNETVQVKL